MSQQKDIIQKIQESHETPSSNIVQVTEILGYAGMFIFYMGLFQMFSANPITKINGIFFFVLACITMAVTTFAPTVAVAYHVVGKKYVKNFVWYGSRMVERNMELTSDPVVIARLGEDDKIVTLQQQDDDIATFMRELGSTFLSDKNVDKKIEDAIRERFAREVDGSNKKGRLSRFKKWLTKKATKQAEAHWSVQ
jgi:hypothetical protein